MATVRNVMVRLSVNERGFSRGFQAATRDVQKFQRATNTGLSKVRTSVRGAASAMKPLTKGFTVAVKTAAAVGALSALSGAAASSALSLIQLVGAIAPVGGLLAAIPGAIGIAAVAFATLKIATSGMGKAFGAALEGNWEKFDKALAKMGPAARRVAMEFKGIVPALHGIRNAVQGAFFAPLHGQMTAVAKVLRGPLSAGLAQVAKQLGSAIADVARFARSAQSVAALRTVLADTVKIISFFRPALVPVLAGFRDMAVVGGKFFADLAPAMGAAVRAFGEWMSAVSRSGQAMEWMRTGLGVLQQLFRILGSVGSLLVSVFKAAGSVGGGLLGTIEKITGQLAAFAKSAEGARTLQAIFAGISGIGRALSPVIVALAQGLGLIAPAIGRIAMTVGPILTKAINALAPALAALEPGITALIVGLGGAIDGIAPALVPIAQALSGIAIAIAPILPVLGELIGMLAQGLAAHIQRMLPSLSTLVDTFGMLALSLGGTLLDVIRTISPYFPGLVLAFSNLLLAIAPMLPTLGQLVAMLAIGLIQALQQLAPSLPALVGAIVQFAFALGQGLLDALVAIAPYLPQMVFALSDLLIALVPLIPPMTEAAIALAPLIPIVIDVIRLLTQLTDTVMPVLIYFIESQILITKSLVSTVTWAWGFIYGFIRDRIKDIGKAIGWFRDLPGKFGKWFGGAKDAALTKLMGFLDWIRGLPGRITRALGSFGNLLRGAGQDLITGLWNGISSMAGWIQRSITNLIKKIIPGPVRKVLGIASPSKLFAGFGVNLGEGLVLGMQASQGMVARAAEGLAGAAVPAMAGPAGPGLPQPRGALRTADRQQQSGIDYQRLAAALVSALKTQGVGAVHLDGQVLTDVVSRRTGQATQLRRRTG